MATDWDAKFRKAGYYIPGNKKKELISGKKYRKLSRKGKKKLYNKFKKKYGSKWLGAFEDQVPKVTPTTHTGGWNWMDVKNKKDAKKINWETKFKEAGFYIKDDGKPQIISSSEWKRMDKEDKWKKYGELTGMTRFSDIDKDNWDKVNWEAKFRDRPGAWAKYENDFPTMNAQQKWEAYSTLKGEVPDDYDDVFGKDDEKDLEEAIEERKIEEAGDFKGKTKEEFAKEYKHVVDQVAKDDPNRSDSIFSDEEKGILHEDWKPDEILSIDDQIKHALTDRTPTEDEQATLDAEHADIKDKMAERRLDPLQQTELAAMDKAGTGDWQKPTATDDQKPVIPGAKDDESQTDVLAKEADVTNLRDNWKDVSIADPGDTSSMIPRVRQLETAMPKETPVGTAPKTDNQLGEGFRQKFDDLETGYQQGQQEVQDPTRDPKDPRGTPEGPKPLESWTGAGTSAKLEGLEQDFSAFNTRPKTGTSMKIRDAMGSKLKQSQAARSGRNTLGTGAFKFRNPLSIN